MKIIYEGEKYPLFYGKVCRYYPCFNAIEVAPIPFNYIKRLWYYILSKDKFTELDKKISTWQTNIRYDGYKDGFRDGLLEGRKQAWQELKININNDNKEIY